MSHFPRVTVLAERRDRDALQRPDDGNQVMAATDSDTGGADSASTPGGRRADREGGGDTRGGMPVIGVSMQRRRHRNFVGPIVRTLHARVTVNAGGAIDDRAISDALDSLLGRMTSGREGEWDSIRIESATHADLFAAAALRHALTMDLSCEMIPGRRDGLEAWLHRGGRRSSLGVARRHASTALRARGLFRLLVRRAGQARRRLVGGHAPDVVLVMDLPPRVVVSSRVPGLEFREASPAEVAHRPRRHASYGTDTEIRLARGDRCVIAARAGEIVSRNWVSLDPDLIARRCPGPAELDAAAYVYDSYTAPEWRGLSIQAAALGWIGTWVAERASRLVLSIGPDNASSLSAARKAGFSVVQTGMSGEAS